MTTPLPVRVQGEGIAGCRDVGEMRPLTNQGCAFRIDNSTREKVEVVLLAVHHHRVPGIIPTLRVQSQDSWRRTAS